MQKLTLARLQILCIVFHSVFKTVMKRGGGVGIFGDRLQRENCWSWICSREHSQLPTAACSIDEVSQDASTARIVKHSDPSHPVYPLAWTSSTSKITIPWSNNPCVTLYLVESHLNGWQKRLLISPEHLLGHLNHHSSINLPGRWHSDTLVQQLWHKHT